MQDMKILEGKEIKIGIMKAKASFSL